MEKKDMKGLEGLIPKDWIGYYVSFIYQTNLTSDTAQGFLVDITSNVITLAQMRLLFRTNLYNSCSSLFDTRDPNFSNQDSSLDNMVFKINPAVADFLMKLQILDEKHKRKYCLCSIDSICRVEQDNPDWVTCACYKRDQFKRDKLVRGYVFNDVGNAVLNKEKRKTRKNELEQKRYYEEIIGDIIKYQRELEKMLKIASDNQ